MPYALTSDTPALDSMTKPQIKAGSDIWDKFENVAGTCHALLRSGHCNSLYLDI